MPEVPAVSRIAPQAVTGSFVGVGGVGDVDAVFAQDGPLARAMPAFEPRDGQVAMARAVAEVFARGGILLAEAGTGTGKTLSLIHI